MKKSTKRIVCGALALTMVSTLALECTLRLGANGVGGAPTASAATGVTYENVTGKFDTSKLMEANFNSSVLKSEEVAPKYETRTVMVTLSGANVIARADGESVPEYLNSWEGDRAVADIQSEQTSFLKSLSKMGISYELERSYNTVLNGVAIKMDTKYVSTVKKMEGVKSVVITSSYSEPKTVATVNNSEVVTNETDVYATGIYDSSEFAAEYGEGTVVAILDTGLDYTHPAYQRFENEDVEVAWSKSFVADKLKNEDLVAEERSGSLDVSDVYVSAKVPFAYDYADDDPDVYPSYSNHGTHVAGIIGGYDTSGYTDKDGNPIRETFKGVVPDAQLVICKVFTDDLDDPDLGGAVPPDIVAALEDCVKLGVDVINMSLGTSCGFSTTNDGDDEGEMLDRIYKAIQSAGISLVCAASNDYSAGYGGVYGTNLTGNPDSGTVGSPSTFAGALSVASINGQKAGYMVANADTADQSYAFFEESRDIDGNPFDFVGQLMEKYNTENADSYTFEYVVVGGVGLASDYALVKNLFKDPDKPRIALISRGDSTFQEKIEIAMAMGAAGAIIYNNVSGTIRMNLGEIIDPIPSVSINMNAGLLMKEAAGADRVGTITVSKTQTAGPFMSEFSSWGPTHDLKLKPEITAHGGEITSTVPGGYGEQSGTSMASPNMAGFMALVRSYIKKDLGITDPKEINRLAMQLTMSTAGTVYDQDNLPYSPRKQGAGVAKLEHVIGGTKAYLSTDVAGNDYRPKIELGDDPDKLGEYSLDFKVTNFGTTELVFTASHLAMTESVSKDGLTVSEQAYLLSDASAVWTVNGTKISEEDKITVKSNETLSINVVLTLTKEEKQYIDANFENGMYVEGFLKLNSENEGQCDLSIPFLGFYGDWSQAPMLDYTAYEVAENAQDASVADEDKIKASVWETLPYSSYYNEQYILPMGGYVYLLPDGAEPMYVSEEHASVSRYNEYYGEGEEDNYLSSTSIKAVYAGLLRNARLVKYRMYNVDTGELVLEDVIYRVGKAYSGGGQGTPANVELELSPEQLGLAANGMYKMEFEFFQEEPESDDAKAREEDTFEFSFTVDYDAPMLEDARIRYYNYEENNKTKQRIYLDVDVYDNHYPQAMMLCYPTLDAQGQTVLMLATDYPTPVRDAVRNGTTTVSVEITEFYEKYGNQLYLQIDDYSVNSCLYKLNLNSMNANQLPEKDDWSLADAEKNITLDIYGTHKTEITYAESYKGSADASNFTWTSSNPTVANVKNGEIVGLKKGTAKIFVSNRKGKTETINVTVTDVQSKDLPKLPAISFGVMKTYLESLTQASGGVEVHAGEEFMLTVNTDPWYYPMDNFRYAWSTSDESVATVDQNGNVKTLKKGSAIIVATLERKNATTGNYEPTLYQASVSLRVRNEFTVSNYMLTDYNGIGWNEEIMIGGELKKALVIPTDMNIWYIDDEAFKDNDNVEIIVIPASVININDCAFENCTALREVYFVSPDHRVISDNGTPNDSSDDVYNANIDWADVTLIDQFAFYNCPNLEKVDFSNAKTLTVAQYAFADCPKLTEVVDMPSIGTMHHFAFANAGLTSVDLSGLHMSGNSVFYGCNGITSVKTGKFTAIGNSMFAGCTGLTEITLSTPKIGNSAFANCSNLSKVTLDAKGEDIAFEIGDRAFENCGTNGFAIDFNGQNVRKIGTRAFAGTGLTSINLNMTGLEVLGSDLFVNTNLKQVTIGDGVDLEALQLSGAPFTGLMVNVAADSTKYVEENGVIFNANKTKILFVNSSTTGEYTVPATVTEIGAYAFANSGYTSVTLHANVTEIGEYAFYNSTIKSVDFAGAAITEILAGTFRGSQVETVALPNSVATLGDYAFASSALKSLTANGLTALGNNVFDSCRGLTEIVLADSITKMGDRVFANCTALTTVTLPSVTSLGARTFNGARNLTKVTFGANATTTGTYTFYGTPVREVVFGGNLITSIGMGTFYNARNLASIVLPESVTEIEAYAFYNASALSSANLENIEVFGAYSFYNNALTALNLESAKKIGEFAFGVQDDNGLDVAAACTSISMPIVEEIGNYAFLNTSATSIELPATLKKMGYGVFGSAAKLARVSVAENNTVFFVEENVLYRNVDSEIGGLELVFYPGALEGKTVNNVRTYTIKEGTVNVLAYAFYGLNKNMLKHVVLPYTMKVVGDSAFYASGVTEYTFESIQAPTLETFHRGEITSVIQGIAEAELEQPYYRGYYYANFETYVFNFTRFSKEKSNLTINYPTNGKGYDNHIYGLYFGEKKLAGVQMSDVTRSFVEAIDAMPEATTVAGWINLDKTAENKAMVTEFSNQLKAARLDYNNAKQDAAQAEYLTAERVEKLTALETALRDVKKAFGVSTAVKEVRVDETCTYKSVYVEGETFDMTGLRAIIVYDDYSTEIVDTADLVLADKSKEPLSRYSRYVEVICGSKTLRVSVTVNANDAPVTKPDSSDSSSNSGKKDGCKSVIGGITATSVLLGTAVCALAVKKRKEND